MNKEEILQYTRQASLFLLAIVCIIFPSFFLTNTTEIFIFPKQVMVTFAALVALVLFSINTIALGKITVKASPFNLPLAILGVVILASSLFSRNMFESLLQTIPVLMLFVLYFVTINNVFDKLSLQILEFSLLAGASLASVISVLQYLKIFIFPFDVAQNQYFNPYGSVIQQLIYIIPLLVLSLYYLIRLSRQGRFDYSFGVYCVSSVIMSISLVISAYQIITLPQKPILLSYQYGFQIALASISQDSARLVQSFLIGSGFGTFASVFTRFRPLAFNGEADLWQLVFSYSSSHFLELVATAGLLGTGAFLFLAYKIVKTRLSRMNGIYAGVMIALLLSFVLPFSYVTLFLLFMLLALYTVFLYVNKHETVYEFTLSLIAWKESIMNFTNPTDSNPDVATRIEKRESRYLPLAFTFIVVIVVLFIGYFTTKLVMAESKFRDSLSSENLNNGQKTYDLQRFAIADFPYRSDYYRVFSQINLALANSILTNLPPNSSPSAQTQQTVLSLLQQSINAGRASAQISPYTSSNWVQLSQVYRNLIGVGQNAESFAVASLQQAIALDPYNPNHYIQLGGIYYQLGAYEQAQNNFQAAIQLKPDLSNGYYNLGHALEAKGDFTNALASYQRVKVLVSSNPANDAQITKEIEALQAKINQKASPEQTTAQTAQPSEVAGATTDNQTLGVDQPSVSLPPRNPQIKISPPPATITPSPSSKLSPTPVPSEEVSP